MPSERITRLSILAGALLIFGNELLSALGALRFWPVACIWIFVIVGLGMACLRGLPPTPPSGVRRSFDASEWGLFGAILLLLSLSFVSALFSPPNSWDSMVHHLPKQVRWIQQGSLAHFPTDIGLQLYRGPFAEIVQTNLQILFGTDLVTQLVSWTAALGCTVLTWGLCIELGVGRRLSLLAALAALAVPGAFLEASTTKNDLVVAFWALCAIWITVRAQRYCRISKLDALLLGASIGLATLTKSTAYLLLLPLVPAVALLLFRQGGRKLPILAVLISLGFVSVNLGYWHRNWAEFGGPLGPPGADRIHFNETMSASRFLSRVTREASLQWGLPWESWNHWWENSIRTIHNQIGVEVVDPSTTYPGRPFRILWLPGNEYQAGAPLHFLIFLALPVLGIVFRRRLPRPWWFLTALSWGEFLLLCLVTRWEPYLNPRLHFLVLFLAIPPFAALLGIIAEQLKGRFLKAPACIPIACGSLLVIQVLPSMWQSPRSALGPVFRPRSELLFIQGNHLREPYEACAAIVRPLAPNVVGLDSRGDWAWEYPLMRLLRSNQMTPKFVSVNPAFAADRPQAAPDVLIVFRDTDFYQDQKTGLKFRKIGQAGFLSIFVPDRQK